MGDWGALPAADWGRLKSLTRPLSDLHVQPLAARAHDQRAFAKELFHSVNMKHHVETFDAVARRLADRFDGLIATARAADGAASAVIDVQDYFMR